MASSLSLLLLLLLILLDSMQTSCTTAFEKLINKKVHPNKTNYYKIYTLNYFTISYQKILKSNF
jgi:hypothetical protein